MTGRGEEQTDSHRLTDRQAARQAATDRHADRHSQPASQPASQPDKHARPVRQCVRACRCQHGSERGMRCDVQAATRDTCLCILFVAFQTHLDLLPQEPPPSRVPRASASLVLISPEYPGLGQANSRAGPRWHLHVPPHPLPRRPHLVSNIWSRHT